MSDSLQAAFKEWLLACAAVQKEMDQLITAGIPSSDHERQQRQRRFFELIEKREAAARNILPANETFKRARAS
jgi:hypothetical protein